MLRVVQTPTVTETNEHQILEIPHKIREETHMLVYSEIRGAIAYGTKKDLVNYLNSLG